MSLEQSYKRLYQHAVIAEWLLRPDQLELYNQIKKQDKVVVDVHRRWGKTHTCLTYIAEECTKNKITVRMGGVTQKAIKDIFVNVMEHVYGHCLELMPKYDSSVDGYTFPNGSKISLFGNANSEEARKSRGSQADIIYLDEYGFWKYKPHETLYSILLPQLQHSKIGKIIITSTMPRDLTHPYLQECKNARVKGCFFWQDIKQSVDKGTMTFEEANRIAERMGGWDSEDFKREYLLQEIASVKDLVIPEAQNESLYVGKQERPAFYDSYVGMDLGLRDCTAVIFGYYDFLKSTLVIEKEYVTNYTTTEEITKKCKQIEDELLFKEKPIRYSDCEQQQIFDMANSYSYSVNPVVKRRTEADKRYVESLINGLRIAIKAGKMLIHPDCVNVITQLKYGIWEENRLDFERTDSMGHLDALMALAYLWDMLDKSRNPYPHYLDGKIGSLDWHVIKGKEKSAFNKVF